MYLVAKPVIPPRLSPYKLALPLDSYGKMMTTIAANTNKPPETYTGTGVPKSPNMATIGASPSAQHIRKEQFDIPMIPKTRLAVAVKAFPVPLSLVGNISGV